MNTKLTSTLPNRKARLPFGNFQFPAGVGEAIITAVVAVIFRLPLNNSLKWPKSIGRVTPDERFYQEVKNVS